jgi:predicted lipid carrier protein YhbT
MRLEGIDRSVNVTSVRSLSVIVGELDITFHVSIHHDKIFLFQSFQKDLNVFILHSDQIGVSYY